MSLLSLDIIAQVGITGMSIGSSFMVSSDKPWRRWGYLIGIFTQPLWFFTIISNRQWGLLPLTFWYTFTWTYGVWNFIIKPRRCEVSGEEAVAL